MQVLECLALLRIMPLTSKTAEAYRKLVFQKVSVFVVWVCSRSGV